MTILFFFFNFSKKTELGFKSFYFDFISRIPTQIPRITTSIPRIPIIPLIPLPDSPFRLLQIANHRFYKNKLLTKLYCTKKIFVDTYLRLFHSVIDTFRITFASNKVFDWVKIIVFSLRTTLHIVCSIIWLYDHLHYFSN